MSRIIQPHLMHDDTFRRLCRARDLLASDFQARLQLREAADEACLSPFHFHRLFCSTFGETPHDFLSRLRIDHAKRLLAAGSPVTEVCFEVGYNSLGTFSSKFRACVGQSPTEYQRSLRRIFGFSAPWQVLFMPVCFLRDFPQICE